MDEKLNQKEAYYTNLLQSIEVEIVAVEKRLKALQKDRDRIEGALALIKELRPQDPNLALNVNKLPDNIEDLSDEERDKILKSQEIKDEGKSD